MKQDLHLAPQHSKCKIEDYEELENSSSDFMDYVLSKSHPSVAGIGVLPSGEAGIVLETLVNNLGKTKTQIDIVSKYKSERERCNRVYGKHCRFRHSIFYDLIPL